MESNHPPARLLTEASRGWSGAATTKRGEPLLAAPCSASLHSPAPCGWLAVVIATLMPCISVYTTQPEDEVTSAHAGVMH